MDKYEEAQERLRRLKEIQMSGYGYSIQDQNFLDGYSAGYRNGYLHCWSKLNSRKNKKTLNKFKER